MAVKFSKLHPLVFSLLLLSAITILIALGMGLVMLVPNSLGLVEDDYAIDSAFAFDTWEINTRHGVLSFPEGGLAIEAYQRRHLVAFVVWGEAQLNPITDEIQTETVRDVQATVIYMTERELLNARGSTVIRNADSPDSYAIALDLLQEEQKLLPAVNIFGNRRSYPFPAGVAKMIFLTAEGQRLVFFDGAQVFLEGPEGSQGFLATPPYRLHPSLAEGAAAAAIYIIFIIFLLTATYFATLGWSENRDQQLQKHNPKRLLFCLAVVVCYAAGRFWLMRLGLATLVHATFDALLLAFLIWLWGQGAKDEFLPEKYRQILSQSALGFFLGAGAVFLGQLSLPKGFNIPGSGALGLLFLALVMTLTRETLWRGLLLQQLRSIMPTLPALLITALLEGGTAYLLWLALPLNPLGLFNAFVFTALEGLWLGYVYLRTGRLLAPAAIAATLVLLPQLLLF